MRARSKRKSFFPRRKKKPRELKWNRVAGVFLDFWRSFLELPLHYFNWPTNPHCQSLPRPLSLDCAFLLTISSPSTATSAFVSRSSLVLQGFHLPYIYSDASPSLFREFSLSESRARTVRKDMRVE